MDPLSKLRVGCRLQVSRSGIGSHAVGSGSTKGTLIIRIGFPLKGSIRVTIRDL